MKKTLESRAEVELMVNTFYEKVRKDAQLGHLFDGVAKVNWEAHLPKMYNFWDNILFDTGAYRGHVMLPHFNLNEKERMQPTHFERWIALFHETIDELFEGERAEDVKHRAGTIAQIMQSKITYVNAYNDHLSSVGNLQ